tara:strand:- start:844 stop:1767 length:924 start_codon:yes stop_codon:yes gene_type:complete
MAGGVIGTGNIARLLEEGVNDVWGRDYNEHNIQWDKLFKEHDSDRAYELDVQMEGFSPAPVKPQGQGVVYDSAMEGFIPKYVMQSIAKGFEVTKEAYDDNQYDLFEKGAGDLALSFRQTEEIIGADVYNRASNVAYTMEGGDGKPFSATDHPLGPTDTGTYSNVLAVGAALSEASVEAILIQINQAVDARGNRVAIKGTQLVVPAQLQFQADRVLKSPLQSGGATNDINAIMNTGMLPQGYCVNNFLTNATRFFIRTDCPNGAKRFTRESMDFERDRDFNTSNFRFQGFERYAYGWTNARTTYANGL